MAETFELRITGFTSKEQVEEFIHWYEGQGEQDLPIWFECRKDEGKVDCEYLNCDIPKTYPIKWNGNEAKMVVRPGN